MLEKIFLLHAKTTMNAVAMNSRILNFGITDNFYLISIYWNPDTDISIFDCLLSSKAAVQESDKKKLFLFVGDLMLIIGND